MAGRRSEFAATRPAGTRSRVAAALAALWLVRRGSSLRAAAGVLGVDERSVRRWVAWYRAGGLAEVGRRRRGDRHGQPAWLTPDQQAQVCAEASEGALRTALEAAPWGAATFGVRYTASGMRALLQRLGRRPKVPRPIAEKAHPVAQAAWKKGGSPRRSRTSA